MLLFATFPPAILADFLGGSTSFSFLTAARPRLEAAAFLLAAAAGLNTAATLALE